MKVVREGRRYDDAPVVEWYSQLPLARQNMSVRGLTMWMLEHWDSKYQDLAPPSERTLRRTLTRIKSEK